MPVLHFLQDPCCALQLTQKTLGRLRLSWQGWGLPGEELDARWSAQS